MKVKVSVYKAADGSFWCHTDRDVYGTGLNACGSTVAEAKQVYANVSKKREPTMQVRGKNLIRWISSSAMISSHSKP